MPYDDDLGFKLITSEDWLEPDMPTYPFKIPEERWIEIFLEQELNDQVPGDIRRLFEVSRGALIYGWNFYPLLTLGFEQLTRVMEAAVREKANQLGKIQKTYHENVEMLINERIIPQAEANAWRAGKRLRNLASHPEGQTLIDPGTAHNQLTLCARRINLLFELSTIA